MLTGTSSAPIRPAASIPTTKSGPFGASSATRVPLPQAVSGRDELFAALRNWVENGVAPTRIEVRSSDGSVSMPLCMYPQKATYVGSGSVTSAGSYTCN